VTRHGAAVPSAGPMPGYGASSDYRDDVSLDPDLGVVYDATGEPLAEHERRTRLGTKKEETTPAPPAPAPRN